LPQNRGWRLRLEKKAQVRVAAFHPDGQRLFAITQEPGQPNRAQFFDSHTGAPLGTEVEVGSDAILGSALNKNGRLLATAAANGKVHVWELTSGREFEIALPPSNSLLAICFHADGRSIFVGGRDGLVQSWDLGNGQRIGEPLAHKQAVMALAVSPDGKRIVVGCWDRSAHLWDLEGRRRLMGFLHQNPVSAVAFSQDGLLLATGGIGKSIRISNASGKYDQRLSLAHPAEVNAVVFSNRGSALATGCEDGAARLWDREIGKQIGPALFHDLTPSKRGDQWQAGHPRSIAFSQDGTRLLSIGDDHNLRIWPVPTPLAGRIEDIIRHIQILTVMELDAAGVPGDLDLPAWERRRAQAPSVH
jgi:WD40 repeat protein